MESIKEIETTIGGNIYKAKIRKLQFEEVPLITKIVDNKEVGELTSQALGMIETVKLCTVSLTNGTGEEIDRKKLEADVGGWLYSEIDGFSDSSPKKKE